jgi:hypothetical protein
MRTVTHLLGRLEDPLPRFLGYVVVATQGAGDGSNGNANLSGNVLKGDSHNVLPVCLEKERLLPLYVVRETMM